MVDDIRSGVPHDRRVSIIIGDHDKNVEYRTALDAVLAPMPAAYRPAPGEYVDGLGGQYEVQSRGRVHCHVVCAKTLRRSRSV